MHEEVGLSLPENIHFTTRRTRHHHPFHLIVPPTNATTYMISYFPRPIREWNSLLPQLIELNTLATFSNLIVQHL